MIWTQLASTAVLVSLLTACSASQEEKSNESAARAQQDAAKNAAQDTAKNTAKNTVFKEMVGTMDKARGVEDTAAQHKEQLDQALERAEGK
jgi:hypothetical protein